MFNHHTTTVRKTTKSMIKRVTTNKVFKTTQSIRPERLNKDLDSFNELLERYEQ